MKKTLLLMWVAFLVVGTMAPRYLGHLESAPNSGDGIPDGSGFVSPSGPNVASAAQGSATGPAPNSGDGVSDGSGMASPHGSTARGGR